MFKLTKFTLTILVLVLISLNIYFLLNAKHNHFNLIQPAIEFKLNDNNNNNNAIINPHDYDYILNPGDRICAGQNVTLLAMVPVSPHKHLNRLIIRTSWMSRSVSPRMRVIFLTGYSSNQTVNEQLREENQLYGDIVQESFMDTYRNLTLKTIMGIKWAAKYCSNAKFFLKIDDDMVVNTPRLIEFLEHKNNTNLKNTFLCNPLWNSEVIRDNTSKFYMSKEEFSADTYGVYCDGPGYIFTNDLVSKLYETSLYTKTFVFEDVYVGMLAHKLNSTFDGLFSWYYVYYDHAVVWNATHRDFDYSYIVYCEYYIDIVVIWEMMQKRFYELYFSLDFYNLNY